MNNSTPKEETSTATKSCLFLIIAALIGGFIFKHCVESDIESKLELAKHEYSGGNQEQSIEIMEELALHTINDRLNFLPGKDIGFIAVSLSDYYVKNSQLDKLKNLWKSEFSKRVNPEHLKFNEKETQARIFEIRPKQRQNKSPKAKHGTGISHAQIMSHLEDVVGKLKPSKPVDGMKRWQAMEGKLIYLEVVGNDTENIYSTTLFVAFPNDNDAFRMTSAIVALRFVENAMPDCDTDSMAKKIGDAIAQTVTSGKDYRLVCSPLVLIMKPAEKTGILFLTIKNEKDDE